MRMTSLAAVAAVVAALGAGVAAGPAAAATSGCPALDVCLYAGSHQDGAYRDVVSSREVVVMGGYVVLPHQRHGSVNNNSPYKMCTYDSSYSVTNVIAPNSTGPLANPTSYYLALCPRS